MTLLFPKDSKLSFEDVVVQRGHLKGVGETLIVVVRHGYGKMLLNSVSQDVSAMAMQSMR